MNGASMASANATHLPAHEAGSAPPAQRIAQIAALLSDPGRITPALLRVKIRAICENSEVPADRKAFVALAERAGVPHAGRYRAWAEWSGILIEDDRDWTEVITVNGTDEELCEPQAETSAVSNPTALYRYYDELDNLLYIGISYGLSGRVSSHIGGSSWMEFAVRSTITRYPSRAEAAEAEEAAIKAEHPLFNHTHNNSPQARQRLVEYLIEHDRLDLLMPSVSRG
jgi:hypothetical protein